MQVVEKKSSPRTIYHLMYLQHIPQYLILNMLTLDPMPIIANTRRKNIVGYNLWMENISMKVNKNTHVKGSHPPHLVSLPILHADVPADEGKTNRASYTKLKHQDSSTSYVTFIGK